MKRAESRLAFAGAALLALALVLPSPEPPARTAERLDLPACSLPARTLAGGGRGLAVLFHGLAANSRTMESLGRTLRAAGMRVVMVDWPGHGDSTEPFSFARLDDCAEQLLNRPGETGGSDPARTVVVGHSMGAAAALRLADRFPVTATVAISPGVTPLPRRMPSNLLVLTGEWDIPRLARFAEELADAAGGERIAPEDFLQRRAFQHLVIPRATHTSLLIDQEALAAAARWAERALPEARAPGGPAGARLLFWCLGALGLLLTFPLAATFVAGVVGARGEPAAVAPTPLGGTLLRWAGAGLLAALALGFRVPLKFLRLYDGDWMVSFALLTGATLLFLLWRRPERAAVLPGQRERGQGQGQTEVRRDAVGDGAKTARAVAAAAMAALAVMLAFGWWLDRQIYDGWLNAPRWWRFLAAAPFLLPYLAAEEVALGAPSGKWRTEVRRYTRLLLLRAVLAGLVAAACFTVGGPLLAILLGPYIALGGIVVRLGADAIRRRTGSAAAAAVFSAILAAWALAASLPLL